MPAQVNFRVKFATDNFAYCESYRSLYTEWEREFMDSVSSVNPKDFTVRQFNALRDVADQIRRRLEP